MILVAVVLVAGLAALGVERLTSGPPAHSQPNASRIPPDRALVVTAGPLTGTWRVHTTAVVIGANGHGSATWPGPLRAGESEATAAPGHADIRLTSVTGRHASAVVTGSTDQSVLPDGPTRLSVTSEDLLYVTPAKATGSSPFGHSGLCGPRALSLTLAQQEAANINCGA